MTDGQKMKRAALWTLPLVLVAAAFITSIPWLQTISPPIAIAITVTVTVFGMSYGNYFGYRALRGLDEVEKEGAAFAAQWGAPLGQAICALLLALPPFQNFMTAIVNAIVNRFLAYSGTAVDMTIVIPSLAMGFLALIVLQSIGFKWPGGRPGGDTPDPSGFRHEEPYPRS